MSELQFDQLELENQIEWKLDLDPEKHPCLKSHIPRTLKNCLCEILTTKGSHVVFRIFVECNEAESPTRMA